MRAAVYRSPGELTIDRIPVPEVGRRDVLVEVRHCGVCGSDLHMVLDGWGRPGSTGGHEYSGVVVEVGPEAVGWSLGDRVIGGPGTRCGTCGPCREGRPSLCVSRFTPGTGTQERNGAFARYVASQDDSLVAVPEGLDLRAAALTEPLSVAVHAVRQSRAEPQSRVLVTGAGPIGLLVIAVLRARGVDDVTVSEPATLREMRAVAVGATATLHPREMARPRMPMDLAAEPFDIAIECSGRGVAQQAALCQLGRAGTLVLVGAGMDHPSFDTNRILLNELVVTGSNEYAEGDYPKAVELLAAGAVPTGLLIEEEDIGLDDLLPTMRKMAAGELAGKVMVDPAEAT